MTAAASARSVRYAGIHEDSSKGLKKMQKSAKCSRANGGQSRPTASFSSSPSCYQRLCGRQAAGRPRAAMAGCRPRVQCSPAMARPRHALPRSAHAAPTYSGDAAAAAAAADVCALAGGHRAPWRGGSVWCRGCRVRACRVRRAPAP